MQRDLEDLKSREAFHVQVVKDQMTELANSARWMLSIIVTLNLAIIGFFWQLSTKRNRDREQ
jgi:hypothetical protein